MLVLLALLLFAVSSDLRAHRIPNALILSGMILAAAVHMLAYFAGAAPLAGDSIVSPLAGLAAGSVLLLPLYLLRGCGAGDVKLLALVGAFLGPKTVIAATIYTFIAGGLLSLAFMVTNGVAMQTWRNLHLLTQSMLRARGGEGASVEPMQTTALRLPYAPAIALGTIAALVSPLPFGLG